MDSILITGCAGLLGSNLAYLLRDSNRVIGIDRNTLGIQRIVFYRERLQDTASVCKILEKEKVDVVVHCAAMTNVDECERAPDIAMEMNCSVTARLVALCESVGAKFVFISTDAVFSGEKEGFYKETDPVSPINIYGKSKRKAEEIVLEHSRSLVVRTNIFGFNYREKLSFSEWIINSLRDNKTLTLFNDVYFTPLLTNKLVELISRSIKSDLSGIYHYASTGSVSKYQMACLIQDTFDLKGEILPSSVSNSGLLAARSHNMKLDNQKLCNMLGVKLPNIRESIIELRNLYDSRYDMRLKRGE